MVFRFVDRALGPSGEAEDLLQETFSRIFSSVGRLRDPSALRSFVFSVAVRTLRSHLRMRRVRRWFAVSETGDVPDVSHPGADTEARALLRRFYRLLDELAPDDRAAFVLRQIEGFSLEELAQATGASLATVKRRVSRASQRLAELVEDEPDLRKYMVWDEPSDE
jgi:RNA polymerase sigma-70 factor (ECF subfamily)